MQSIYDIAKQFTQKDIHSITSLSDGAINKTYLVKAGEDEHYWLILQEMHHMFAPKMMIVIEKITAIIASRGITTLRPHS